MFAGFEAQWRIQRRVNGDARRFGKLGRLRGLAYDRVDTIEHSAQDVRMNRAHYTVTCVERTPIGSLHTRRPPARDFYPCDISLGQHLSAVILDARNERVGERSAAANRHAETISFEEAKKHKGADAGALLVGRHEIFAGNTGEVHPDLVVL